MVQEIIPIQLKLPYRMGSVNCYLVKTNTGFILVDTGSPHNWKELERQLEQFGCNSGNIHLIVLTHVLPKSMKILGNTLVLFFPSIRL